MELLMNVTKTKLLFQTHGKMIADSEVTVKIVNNWMYLTMYLMTMYYSI